MKILKIAATSVQPLPEPLGLLPVEHDGRKSACLRDGTVRLWDLTAGQEILKLVH
jgi:hypothetical protein